ncbi:MAG TPA: hypothetical protein VE621_07940 [Bryobacteraceae bacterium]|nr:hypothetical protein [Bryobacteraceae bacterium]
MWITSYELALIAILVGQLIGSAVRRGSAGLGGRRLQILAVALTYVAITFSYIPLLIKGVSEASKQRMEKSAKQESTKSEKSPQEVAPFGPVQIVLTLLFLGGLALFVPFLQLEDPLNGLLGLGIIFFGLQRAWSLTARSDAELHGPFSDQPSEAHA